MKKLIFTILICTIALYSFAQSPNWQQLNIPSLTSSGEYDLAFTNNNIGYAVSRFELYKTNNSGDFWRKIMQLDTSGNSGYFTEIFKVNNSIVLYSLNNITDSVKVYKQLNGDSTFTITTTYFDSTIHFYPRTLVRDSLWYTIDDNDLVSEKNGQRRTVLSESFTGEVSVWKNKYMAVHNFSKLALSNDSGKTWTETGYQPYTALPAYANAFNLGGDTLIYHYGGYPWIELISYDAGLNWINRAQVLNQSRPSIVQPIGNSKNLIGARDTRIMISTNLGFTFQQDTIAHSPRNFYQLNDSTIFAMCNNGVIYKSTNLGGIVGLAKNSNNLNQQIKLYPNPTQNKLEIKAKNLSVKQIRITDVEGKQVLESNKFKKIINVSNLQPGIYIIEFNTTQGKIQKKFVKQ